MTMPLSYLFTCVAVMAGVTYLTRVIPLVFMRRRIRNRFLSSFLFYVPFAVLAAMTFPDIFYSTSGLYSALTGLAVALLLAYRGRGLLTVALGAVGAVFVAEQLAALFF